MTNVLKHKRNIANTNFGAQQIVVVVLQFRIGEVIPRAGVTVKQCLRLDYLPTVPAPLTLEGIVSFAGCSFLEKKELSQFVSTEVQFSVFQLVNDAGAQ